MQEPSLIKNECPNHRNKQTSPPEKTPKQNVSLHLVPARDNLTGFFGELREGLHPLLPVAALRGNGGDVGPAEGPDDVHHGLSLEGVWWYHPREEVIAPVVTQLRGR